MLAEPYVTMDELDRATSTLRAVLADGARA